MLTPLFWRKYFEVYDTLNELRPYQELLSKIVTEASIRSGDVVLDAGAGTGNLACKIVLAGGKVTGFDFSEEGLKIFSRKLPHERAVVGDLIKPLPFGDHCFDVVCTNNAVYTLPETVHAALFAEFYRVLKPGGRIVTSNIRRPFKPMRIYTSHLKSEIARSGLVTTLVKMLRFLVPTIRIFYYNARIKRSNHSTAYHFFSAGEQKRLLLNAGFAEVSDDILTYAEQAILNKAKKPFE